MAFLPKQELRRFLAEDLGKGDITSKLLRKQQVTARIFTRQEAIIAGTNFAKQIFTLKNCRTQIKTKDGRKAKVNQVILQIKGDATAILSCERTVLNLLSRMCGIATKTNKLSRIIIKSNPRIKLLATRKTAPGLRYFDKYAVKIGGGEKHRMTLNDMIMFKDNHLTIEKSIPNLIAKAKKMRKNVEIEVENQKDAILAAKHKADIIMLDNFKPRQVKNTIKKLNDLNLRKKVSIEASGGINEKNISQFAKTGIDMISVGEITNSPPGIDLSLEIKL